MAVFGRRSAARIHDDIRQSYCVCGDPNHRIYLWVPRGDDLSEDFGQIAIYIGHSPRTWRNRLASMCELLRNGRSISAEIILNYAELVIFRDSLSEVICEIEARTVPD